MKQRRKEGKEGGENEREEGIERETMGARGTSRHTHIYSPSSDPGLDLHRQHTHMQELIDFALGHAQAHMQEWHVLYHQIAQFCMYKSTQTYI